MLKIGLTGGIGSGKTAVSNLFEKLGITVIDTDIIARSLLDNDKTVSEEVISCIGNTILDKNKKINRKKLAHIVFNDKTKKQKLENIIHPRVRDEIDNQIRSQRHDSKSKDTQNKQDKYAIIVIPLLFETDFDEKIDRTLVVLADENTRVKRIQQRDNRNMDEIRSIIASQIDDKTRRSKASDIIVNDKDFNKLEIEVRKLHNLYTQLSSTE